MLGSLVAGEPTALLADLANYNRKAAPFRWTYDGRPLMAA